MKIISYFKKTHQIAMKLIYSFVLLLFFQLTTYSQSDYPEYPRFELSVNVTDLLLNASSIEAARRHPRVGRNTFSFKQYRKKNKYRYLALSVHPDNVLRRRRFSFFLAPTSNIDQLGEGFLLGLAIGEEFKHEAINEKWQRAFRYEFKYLWGEKRANGDGGLLEERSTNALGFGMFWDFEFKLNQKIGIGTGIGFHYFMGTEQIRRERASGGISDGFDDFYDRFELSYPNAIQLNIRLN